MKDSIKHLTFVQAALVSLVLVSCSNVHTTQGPSVKDVVAEVINTNNIAEALSSSLVGNSVVNSPVRSPSNRSFSKNVKEPAVQGIQENVLQANYALDVKPTYESQWIKPVTIRPEELNIAPQKHDTVLTGDALKEVFRGRDIIQEPTMRDVSTEIITAVELMNDDNTAEEHSLDWAGHSIVNSSVRSNSVWMSRRPSKPAVQRIQGHVLQANNALDVKPTYESQLNERVTRMSERPNITLQKHDAVLIGDALKDILGGNNTIQTPTTNDTIVEVIGNGSKTESLPNE